ncbi:MAG: hypothetical protein A2219_08005 [Elusimicrobia bacterium RIFOXYA2_FULL_50_26]|nr:MAG: hypothetical protein A2219_08005 [Elusimicrobia bacterium RIFOXYA2_FULL_50_26]
MKTVQLLVLTVFWCGLVFAEEPEVFYCNGPKNTKMISITFDDGPGPYTEKILGVLKSYGIKATFFMEGSQVQMRPALAKLVADEGHEIGGHSYSHPDFYHYEKDDREQLLLQEFQKTDSLIERATGRRPLLVRMPHGYVRPWVKKTARDTGHILVNWTFGCDWKPLSPEDIAAAYGTNIRSGAIFLMHDGGRNRARTLDALPKIIEEAQSRGYAIVPLGTLLGLEATTTK